MYATIIHPAKATKLNWISCAKIVKTQCKKKSRTGKKLTPL
jgi:hypothetical protein